MIYVQLRARVKLAQGETLHVADAAKVLRLPERLARFGPVLRSSAWE